MYPFTGPFGVTTYGCHINGYTYKNGEMMMWVAKRSPTKQTYPNLLDQFVSQQKRQFGVSERHVSLDNSLEASFKPVKFYVNLFKMISLLVHCGCCRLYN